MTGNATAVVLLSVVVSLCFAAGQLLMKRAVGAAPGDAGLAMIVASCLGHWAFWAGGAATGLGAVLWLKVLSLGNLSTVYPLVGLTFVFVMLAGVWVLGERLTAGGVVGAVLVIAGVVVIAWRGL